MHPAAALALRNLVPEIGQAHVVAEPLDQFSLSVLTRAATSLAIEPHDLAGVFSKGQRAIH